MSEDRCELYDMPAIMCAHCRGLKEPQPTDGLLINRFLRAQYDGRCVVDSDHEIRQGDDIGQVEDEGTRKHVGYACTDCVRAIAG